MIKGTIIFKNVCQATDHDLEKLLKPNCKKLNASTVSPLFSFIKEIIKPYEIGTEIIKTII